MNNLSLQIDKNGVANLIFNLPNEKINKLCAQTILELESAINVIDGNKGIRLLIITSGKKDILYSLNLAYPKNDAVKLSLFSIIS